jgi:hypothetical protein
MTSPGEVLYEWSKEVTLLLREKERFFCFVSSLFGREGSDGDVIFKIVFGCKPIDR